MDLTKFKHKTFLEGNIILINADCQEVMAEIRDKEIDLVLTDPPYGIGFDKFIYSNGSGARARRFKEIKNKIISNNWDKKIPEKKIFDNIFRISKNQIIWGGNYFVEYLPPSMGWIYWHKKGNDKSNFSDGELAFSSFNKALKFFKYDWIGFGSINNLKGEKKSHPTQKPVALMNWCLNNYSKENDLIFDGFFGSGTTAISCIRTKRRLIACELDPIYFEKAVERVETELRQGVLF